MGGPTVCLTSLRPLPLSIDSFGLRIGLFFVFVVYGWSSASYPSDHIMLCTDIAFSVAGAGTGMVTRPQTHRRHLLTGVGAAKNRLGTAPRPGR